MISNKYFMKNKFCKTSNNTVNLGIASWETAFLKIDKHTT
jgi:hypothetical protein